MDAEWNPHSPVTKGVEFGGIGTSSKRIGAPTEQQVIRWRAAASTDLDVVNLFADAGSSAPPLLTGTKPLFTGALVYEQVSFGGITTAGLVGGGYDTTIRAGVLAELCERADELHDGTAVQEDVYLVSGVDNSLGRDFRKVASAAVPTTADVLTPLDGLAAWNADALPCAIGLRFDTSGFAADRHVIGVTFEVRTLGATWAAIQERKVGDSDIPSHWHGHIDAVAWTQPEPGTAYYRLGELYPYIDAGNAGPWELRWWNTDRIRDFDTGGHFRLLLLTQAADTANSSHYIDYVAMHVYSIPERRAAVGVLSPVQDPALGWSTANMLTPDAAAAPALTSGDDYSLIVRTPVQGQVPTTPAATLRLRRMRGTPPFANYEVLPVTEYETSGSQQPTAVGAVEDVFVPWVLWDGIPGSGGTRRDDSIPDRDSGAMAIGHVTTGSGPGPYWIAAARYLPTAGGSTYDVAEVLMSTDMGVTGDLQVSLFAFGYWLGTGYYIPPEAVVVTVTAADVEAAPEVGRSKITLDGVTRTVAWHRVRVDFGAGPVSHADPGHVLAFNSTADDSGWLVAALIHGAFDAAVTYDGYNDFVSQVGGTNSLWNADGSLDGSPVYNAEGHLVISQKPDPPTAVGVTAQLADYAGVEHPYAELTWAAPAGGAPADFGGYEVQRWDARTGWQTVALIADAGQFTWEDHEPRLGEETTYRVRTVRAGDDVAGDWVTAGPVTIPAPDGCLLSFTTNEDPTLNVAYADSYPGDPARTYGFPEAAEMVTHKMYGRDYQVAFRPTEIRGVAFSRSLDIAHADENRTMPDPQGPDQFTPLRDLAHAAVSYVCVRDSDGNRWFAAITVPDGVNRVWAGTHKATVTVVETTATPTVVTA